MGDKELEENPEALTEKIKLLRRLVRQHPGLLCCFGAKEVAEAVHHDQRWLRPTLM